MNSPQQFHSRWNFLWKVGYIETLDKDQLDELLKKVTTVSKSILPLTVVQNIHQLQPQQQQYLKQLHQRELSIQLSLHPDIIPNNRTNMKIGVQSLLKSLHEMVQLRVDSVTSINKDKNNTPTPPTTTTTTNPKQLAIINVLKQLIKTETIQYYRQIYLLQEFLKQLE
jgi:hypothetical protein